MPPCRAQWILSSALHRCLPPLFLPAAGNRNGTDVNDAGSWGNYWSSSLNADNPRNAYNLNFNSENKDWNNNNRYYGHSVRPVLQPSSERLQNVV